MLTAPTRAETPILNRMQPPPVTARAAALTLIALVALTASDAGAIGPKDRRFFSARAGIGVDAPAGWTISTHTGYPNIIVLLLHPDGSRISVAVFTARANISAS